MKFYYSTHCNNVSLDIPSSVCGTQNLTQWILVLFLQSFLCLLFIWILCEWSYFDIALKLVVLIHRISSHQPSERTYDTIQNWANEWTPRNNSRTLDERERECAKKEQIQNVNREKKIETNSAWQAVRPLMGEWITTVQYEYMCVVYERWYLCLQSFPFFSSQLVNLQTYQQNKY